MSRKQRFVSAIIEKVELSDSDKKELKTGLLKASTKSVEILMILLKANVNQESPPQTEAAAV
jgi:hypothetical protein